MCSGAGQRFEDFTQHLFYLAGESDLLEEDGVVLYVQYVCYYYFVTFVFVLSVFCLVFLHFNEVSTWI